MLKTWFLVNYKLYIKSIRTEVLFHSHITHRTLLTPKRHKSSKKYSSTIVKQEKGTSSITSVSEIPEVTPFITKWTHEEMFTCIVADIITVEKQSLFLTFVTLNINNINTNMIFTYMVDSNLAWPGTQLTYVVTIFLLLREPTNIDMLYRNLSRTSGFNL